MTRSRMNLGDLPTPSLILDADKLDANVARMRAQLARLGVALRPHVKTAKSIDVARGCMASPRGPITVSTLREADHFAEHGVTDILYAVGITPDKLAHVAKLRASGVDLNVILDSHDAAEAIVAFARSSGARIPALIEVDCDGHRSGLRPDDSRLVEIGRVLGAAHLAGVMTHAGSSYHCATTAAIAAMAIQERDAVVVAAQRLRAAALPCPIVSVGSTPTATFATDLAGVTEVRAGVFVFFDLVMAGIDVCRVEDIALSVLTSVIGHQREKGWVITDAGWMALSRDRGTAKQRVDQGYGVVCDLDGTVVPDLIVADANQEHGVLAARPGGSIDLDRYPLGTRLRVLPNHACATGAQFDAYQVVRGGREVLAAWPRIRGW